MNILIKNSSPREERKVVIARRNEVQAKQTSLLNLARKARSIFLDCRVPLALAMTVRGDVEVWLNAHPKVKQWGWFIALWCAGLLTVSVAT